MNLHELLDKAKEAANDLEAAYSHCYHAQWLFLLESDPVRRAAFDDMVGQACREITRKERQVLLTYMELVKADAGEGIDVLSKKHNERLELRKREIREQISGPVEQGFHGIAAGPGRLARLNAPVAETADAARWLP